MKTHQLASALVMGLLCLAQGSAFAQPGHGNGNGNGNSGHCGNGDQGCEREQQRNGNQSRNNRQPQGEQQSHGADERGAGPGHAFYRGDRLPNDYRARQYVVDDWRGHGLRSPPRGYHWVQTGGDYVLVAITTGVILELLLNH